MNRLVKTLSAAVVAAGMGTAASAAVLDLIGDKDCFGAGGACTEGATLPGGWGAVTQGGGDPAFTDIHTSSGGTTSWTHSFGAGTYTGGMLSIRTAGIADIAGPYDVLVDGVSVGMMPFDGFGHILVETFTFAVGAALLADGMATVSFDSVSGDSWAIDYSELTADMAAIPVPASLPLLGGALFGLIAFGRRRKADKA
ncbi:MAG: hypothetical protein ACK5MY_05690 [Jhaorihella sp.]